MQTKTVGVPFSGSRLYVLVFNTVERRILNVRNQNYPEFPIFCVPNSLDFGIPSRNHNIKNLNRPNDQNLNSPKDWNPNPLAQSILYIFFLIRKTVYTSSIKKKFKFRFQTVSFPDSVWEWNWRQMSEFGTSSVSQTFTVLLFPRTGPSVTNKNSQIFCREITLHAKKSSRKNNYDKKLLICVGNTGPCYIYKNI